IGAFGFTRALIVAAVASLVVMLAAAAVMRRDPRELGLGPDGDPVLLDRDAPPLVHDAGTLVHAAAPAGTVRPPRGRGDALRTWRFWSVSAPFALGLAAQVGVLTHLVAVITPTLGADAAGSAVSATTAAALLGRLVTGVVVDRLNRRLVASVTLIVQILGVTLLARAGS